MNLDKLMRPRTLAVIGASRDEDKWGSRVLSNTVAMGFEGGLYGVNPNFSGTQHGGVLNVPSLDAIDQPVDCALIALPRDHVLGAVRDCAVQGVGAVVIVAAGFAESGDTGRTLQSEVLDLGRQSGMRILGPNCFGLFGADARVNLTTRSIPSGDVALASQSGNLAIELWEMAKKRGIGFSYCVGVGNQLDVGFAELLEFFAYDSQTRAIALYLEGLPERHGQSFQTALAACIAASKPVIVLKAGRSRMGAISARTHTAALAADDRVWASVLSEQGVTVASSTEDVTDLLLGATKLRKHEGRIAVLTDGGGCSVLAADAAQECGLTLARLDAGTQGALDVLIPPAAPRAPGRNPVTLDTPGGMDDDPRVMARCAEILARDSGVDIIAVAGILGGYQGLQEEQAETVRCLVELSRTGHAVALQSTHLEAPALMDLRRAGIPTFPTIQRMMRAIALWSRQRTRDADVRTAEVGSTLPFDEVAAILEEHSIRLPSWCLVRAPSDLETALEGASWPACVKLADPAISHKSEEGGVVLNLASADQVRRAAIRLWTAHPSSSLLLMPTLNAGFEALVGSFSDPVFGPIVVIGRGGIWAEVERDTIVLTSPSNKETSAVENALGQLRCYPMLTGLRGQTPLDLPALASLAVRFARLAEVNPDLVLEANPVFLYPSGCAIADIRAVRRPI